MKQPVCVCEEYVLKVLRMRLSPVNQRLEQHLPDFGANVQLLK
jgi:hypothetical protein